jgi:hypothetical protein
MVMERIELRPTGRGHREDGDREQPEAHGTSDFHRFPPAVRSPDGTAAR